MHPTAMLADEAARRGGDLIRLTKSDQLEVEPEYMSECAPVGAGSPKAAQEGIRMPGCIPINPTVVGQRFVRVSQGRIWRYEPALAPSLALSLAASKGDEATMRLLLTRISNPDALLDDPPPLHAASGTGRADFVDWLLDHGATVDLTWRDQTALDLGVAHGHEPVVRRLLAAGAKVGRERALVRAAGQPHVGILRALLEAGVNPSARDDSASRETALHVAVYRGTPEGVRILLGAGADVHAENVTLQKPIQIAVLHCREDVTALLLAAGADPRDALRDELTVQGALMTCGDRAERLFTLLDPGTR